MNAVNLIVGLGNPGKEYENTRHNAGFWALDELASGYSASWSFEKLFLSFVTKIKYEQTTTYLIKPQTFMNRSGAAVSSIMKYHKILTENLFVIHDELDLLPGQLKTKKGGSNAGHNGLKDIQRAIGSPDFWRIRIGIGHPRTLNLTQNVADFVLHAPKHSDRILIQQSIDLSLQMGQKIITGQFASQSTQ